MSTLTTTRNYADGDDLTEAELDAAFDSIETWGNGNIGSANIASGGVDTTNIASSAVIAAKIATDAVTTAKVQDGAITAGKLNSGIVDDSTIAISSNQLIVKSGGIGSTQLASSSVTAAKITTGTITGVKLIDNIDFGGNAVTENGKQVVVSSTNASTSLAVIRGSVTSAGDLLVGEGFTSAENSTGSYTVSWSNAFASTPVVVACLFGDSTHKIEVDSMTSSSAVIKTRLEGSSTASAAAFNFIAFGPR